MAISLQKYQPEEGKNESNPEKVEQQRKESSSDSLRKVDYLDQIEQSGEIVALKLIPKVGHTDKDIKSLRCECKIQKELKHPNIVRMIDAFETDNEVISVAEYVPGELFRLFDQYKAGMYSPLDYQDYKLII